VSSSKRTHVWWWYVNDVCAYLFSD
jgi:hypothetical protein